MSAETFQGFGKEPLSAWAKPGQKVQIELGAIDKVRATFLATPAEARAFAAALTAAADRAERKS